MTTTNNDKPENYIGLTAIKFKSRYNNHTASFRHINKRSDTELSAHIWKLKEQGTEFNIKWKIIQKTLARKSGTVCKLQTMHGREILHYIPP